MCPPLQSLRPSLKLLAERILGLRVQQAEHCSVSVSRKGAKWGACGLRMTKEAATGMGGPRASCSSSVVCLDLGAQHRLRAHRTPCWSLSDRSLCACCRLGPPRFLNPRHVLPVLGPEGRAQDAVG